MAASVGALADCWSPPQGRVSQLEEELGEERSSSDRTMERLDKTKSQAGFPSPVVLSVWDGERVDVLPAVLGLRAPPHIWFDSGQIEGGVCGVPPRNRRSETRFWVPDVFRRASAKQASLGRTDAAPSGGLWMIPPAWTALPLSYINIWRPF